MNTLLLIAAIPISFFLHIFIHELGHLVAGKMSGYGFVSFRIFSLTLVKINGKLRFKKYQLPGTGGQCLMSPPPLKNGRFPFILYNLGGGLLNILFSLAAIGLLIFVVTGVVQHILVVFAFIGLFLGLMNVIPLKIDGIANDGRNIGYLMQDKKTQDVFWTMMQMIALLTSGVRLRDMPSEWFEVDMDNDFSDSIVAATFLYRLYLLLDKGEIERAQEYSLSIAQNPKKMHSIYQNEIKIEAMFLEQIGEARPEIINQLNTESLRKYIKASKLMPARQRLMYALTKDPIHKSNFEKACEAYPILGTIAYEKELFALVDEEDKHD